MELMSFNEFMELKKRVDEARNDVSSKVDTSSRYFQNIVKRHLEEIKDEIKNSKKDSGKRYYQTRYDVQLKDFAKALKITPEELEQLISKN